MGNGCASKVVYEPLCNTELIDSPCQKDTPFPPYSRGTTYTKLVNNTAHEIIVFTYNNADRVNTLTRKKYVIASGRTRIIDGRRYQVFRLTGLPTNVLRAEADDTTVRASDLFKNIDEKDSKKEQPQNALGMMFTKKADDTAVGAQQQKQQDETCRLIHVKVLNPEQASVDVTLIYRHRQAGTNKDGFTVIHNVTSGFVAEDTVPFYKTLPPNLCGPYVFVIVGGNLRDRGQLQFITIPTNADADVTLLMNKDGKVHAVTDLARDDPNDDDSSTPSPHRPHEKKGLRWCTTRGAYPFAFKTTNAVLEAFRNSMKKNNKGATTTAAAASEALLAAWDKHSELYEKIHAAVEELVERCVADEKTTNKHQTVWAITSTAAAILNFTPLAPIGAVISAFNFFYGWWTKDHKEQFEKFPRRNNKRRILWVFFFFFLKNTCPCILSGQQ